MLNISLKNLFGTKKIIGNNFYHVENYQLLSQQQQNHLDSNVIMHVIVCFLVFQGPFCYYILCNFTHLNPQKNIYLSVIFIFNLQ